MLMCVEANILRIASPAQPGDYEVRYVTVNWRAHAGAFEFAGTPSSAPGTLQVLPAQESGDEVNSMSNRRDSGCLCMDSA